MPGRAAVLSLLSVPMRRLVGRDRPEVIRSLNQMDHLACRVKGQRVRGEARSWRDVRGHVAGPCKLAIRQLRQQDDDQVFKRDHANAELHQFGIRQLGNHISFVAIAIAIAVAVAVAAVPARHRILTLWGLMHRARRSKWEPHFNLGGSTAAVCAPTH